jgi:hypothetical protein
VKTQEAGGKGLDLKQNVRAELIAVCVCYVWVMVLVQGGLLFAFLQSEGITLAQFIERLSGRS